MKVHIHRALWAEDGYEVGFSSWENLELGAHDSHLKFQFSAHYWVKRRPVWESYDFKELHGENEFVDQLSSEVLIGKECKMGKSPILYLLPTLPTLRFSWYEDLGNFRGP